MAPASKPGPVTFHENHDVSPGSCDISNSADEGDADCNEKCYSDPACKAYVLGAGKCWLKSCAAPLVDKANHNASVITGPHPPCTEPALSQRSVAVLPR